MRIKDRREKGIVGEAENGRNLSYEILSVTVSGKWNGVNFGQIKGRVGSDG